MTVDQPPLPPHERPWRHPSELGPTRGDVAPSGSGAWTLALGSGAVAVVAVAVMLVTVMPPQAADPLTSVTTTPAGAVRAVRSDATAESARDRLVALTRIPNAVSSARLAVVDDRRPADEVPGDSDPVIVLTDEFTYWVEWAALEQLVLPEESLVLHAGGDLIGQVRAGRLVVVVDDD